MNSTHLESSEQYARLPQVTTMKRKPHRTQWSIRSLLLWMTVIGVQLALFRVSPLIGMVFLVFIMPSLLMAGLRRTFGFEKRTIHRGAKIWSCLFCMGIPAGVFLYAGYSEFAPPNLLWMLVHFLILIAIPGVFLAIFHYVITIILYDMMDETIGLIRISRRHYHNALPAKQITIKIIDADSAAKSQMP